MNMFLEPGLWYAFFSIVDILTKYYTHRLKLCPKTEEDSMEMDYNKKVILQILQ